MTLNRLVIRGITHYWRTNLAVVLGVVTAVAVLAGALLVGDSVRGSLRDLVLQRLGRTDEGVLSSEFFREALPEDLRADAAFAPSFEAICPLIVMQGVVTEQASGRRTSRVLVYGVDDRFWRFHGIAGTRGPDARDALLSRALASDIGAARGSTVLVRVERPSAIPIESLQGRKDDLGRTLRLTVRGILSTADLGEFTLRPQQGNVRAVFVPLRRIQQDLGLDRRVNMLLVSNRDVHATGAVSTLEAMVRRRAALEDVGLRVISLGEPRRSDEGSRADGPRRPIAAPVAADTDRDAAADGRANFSRADAILAVESASGLLDGPRAKAADEAAAEDAMTTRPVFTYVANSIRSGDRQIPYSLVTAIDLRSILPAGGPVGASARPPIVVNEWAARDLRVRVGDPLTLEYYVWEEPGRLVTRTADFQIAAVVPIEGSAADRNLAPVYPGMTEAKTLADWDPPFPIDLRRIRRVDEEYWEAYRTTPKAFIPFEVGQALWRSRYGDRTSVRIVPNANQSPADARDRYVSRLREKVDPLAMGMAVRDIRADSLFASRGATDFGEYFTYFSVFLVISALMLAALFFRLTIEQRAREVGLLRAVGFTTARVRRLFLTEGFMVAAGGSVIGIAGAVGYGAVMMTGLRTWWAGAVGTTSLSLHVAPGSLMLGGAAALAAATGCIWWTLRGLAGLSERSLLSGKLVGDFGTSTRVRGRVVVSAGAFTLLGAGLIVAAFVGLLDRTSAFFGAGTSLLVACLCLIARTLRRPTHALINGRGWWAVWRLGLRNASNRPGRSVLAIAVIASATFILISVDAFRRETVTTRDRHSGVGGYSVLVELLLPFPHDPNSREGREALGLTGVRDATLEPFRVLPGDDASCLNLYEPRNPRIVGASLAFIMAGRFAFQSSLATNDAERANPWLLLTRDALEGVVPVIGDANSLTYVLHKNVGDDIIIKRGDSPVRLRVVAALADSIFQGELLMSEANFLQLFPEQEGYHLLLVETPEPRASQLAATIEDGAADLGADATLTVDRLAEFHAVENTYLSTFKTLGAFGLLLGTVGLAAVLLRNVLERRRELALLGATGYRRTHIFAIVIAENVLLLGWGLLVGTLCAGVAIAPAVAERGGRLPAAAGAALLLLAVFAGGLLSSLIATRAALRTPLLEALRTE